MSQTNILIGVYSSLSPELGAAQMAINFAESLRRGGATVTLWSPSHRVYEKHWTRRLSAARQELNDYLLHGPQFDIVDLPPFLITRVVCSFARCKVVARSVQPDLLYLWAKDVPSSLSFKGIRRYVAWLINAIGTSKLVLNGWSRAGLILCLGTSEERWMLDHFPRWRSKIAKYNNALSDEDSRRLELIRDEGRIASPTNSFIWIGRWSGHKGVNVLLEFISRRIIPSSDCITIAGCGEAGVLDLAKRGLLGPRVSAIPKYDRQDLPDLLLRHDFGLFTSHVEGWGLSLNEMLESGLTVYATDAGGVTDLRQFFPERLRPFSMNLKTSPMKGDQPEFWAAYHRKFNWDYIAKAYVETVQDRSA